LFSSLASVLGERAIGVVLSGTASDGTEGLRAIQRGGGLTFVQDPSTAQFDQMPRSAIAAGVAEVVLPPAQIADELGAIAQLVTPRPKVGTKPHGIDFVLEQLREATGVDFASYKRATIERRLARRLAKHRLESLHDYANYIVEHPGETTALYEDLLIHVTEFFRDRPALDELVAKVFSEIKRDKPLDVPIRVWVPGCSTGEEVYSLAILLLEQVGEQRLLQLFGTDVSERAIETARAGRYPESIAAQVGPERLAKFFVADGNGYQIKRSVRERCVFVRHDLVSDPPFSKLDLVSCRNVLIYLGAALQKRVVPIFHYALNQPGYLLLGRSEVVAGFESLFTRIDTDAPIFLRKPSVGRSGWTFPAGQLGRPNRRAIETPRSTVDVQRDVDHVLLARYAPACVIVDDNLDIIQFRGRTGPYLEPAPGQPQHNLIRMARDGLASELRLAIQRAQRGDALVRKENIAITEDGHERRVHVEVVPLRGPAEAKRFYLVVFEEALAAVSIKPARRGKAPKERTETVRLRQELAATKEYLHSVVAQHLATSEELGVTNEELQSANEELQSSNEELQTAKEELQSTNEELETVNEELQRGNQDLRQLNDDLVNVLASVDLAIIIVDAQRRIRRFTPKARAVMKLIPTDIGRPIADLQPSLAIPELDRTIDTVIESLATSEAEVVHADGTCYRMQIRPYRTSDNKINGAVIAFVDITTLRRSVEDSRAARDYATAVVNAVPTPLVVVDARLVVESANHAFGGLVATELVGRPLFELAQWRGAEFRASLERVITSGEPFDGLEIEHHPPTGPRQLLLAGARIIPHTDSRRLLLISMVDITERRRAEQEREAFLNAVSHELRTPLSAILLWTQVLRELDPTDARHKQGIDTIEQSARAEARLVDDLLELALSRSKLDELSVNAESIDPSSVIGAAVDAARSDATNKNIAIESALATGTQIQADPRRLRQITSNLMSNAIKFTPTGGRVWVSLVRQDHVMELSVRDSGKGIPREFLAKLFEPFSQLDRSMTRAQPGLGIGLALVRSLVERQGGTIEVECGGNGRGATFTVRLPANSA
jgi:two-component system CheB/CheR fusion protein